MKLFFFLPLFIESTSHVTQCYPIAAKLLNPVRRKHAREAAFIIQAHFRSTDCVVHPESIQPSEDLSLFGESPSINQRLWLNCSFYCDYNFSLPWVKHTLCIANGND